MVGLSSGGVITGDLAPSVLSAAPGMNSMGQDPEKACKYDGIAVSPG